MIIPNFMDEQKDFVGRMVCYLTCDMTKLCHSKPSGSK